MSRPVSVRGEIVQYEHGRYLVAMPRCPQERSGIVIQGNFHTGGTKGRGVSATVEGKLVKSTVGVPRFIQAPYVAFSAARVRYGKSY